MGWRGEGEKGGRDGVERRGRQYDEFWVEDQLCYHGMAAQVKIRLSLGRVMTDSSPCGYIAYVAP